MILLSPVILTDVYKRQGALLISSNGEVRHINKLAKIYLHFNEPKLSEILLQDVKEVAENTAKTHRNNIREIHRRIDDFQFLLQVRSLYVNESDGDVLCIINPFSQIQEQINQNEGETSGIAVSYTHLSSAERRSFRQPEEQQGRRRELR